ncbi:hypothetical protein [Chitinophaga arvensicola]|nr:hypothetical protein [Chitinophaga arvensicola]
MADSIWAGIEMQLDVATSPPDQHEQPALRYKSTTRYGVIGATIIVIAALLWWYYHQHPSTKNTFPRKPDPTVKQAPPFTDSPVKPNHSVNKSTPVIPITTKKDTLLLNNETLHSNRDSSGYPISVPYSVPTTPDSVFLPINTSPDRVFDSIYTLPKYPKPRGVKGITSEDYRISVKQDSIRK